MGGADGESPASAAAWQRPAVLARAAAMNAPAAHPSPIGGVDAVADTVSGTVSGRFVDLLAPDWRDIDLDDVAHGLARVNRWAGQARRAFSNAEHCLLAGRLVPPRFRLAADLHDAHEAIIGDLIKPFKRALVARVGENVAFAVKRIKFDLDVAVARAVVERFAPALAHGFEGCEIEARFLADEMWSDEVKAAAARAGRYEDAVRRRDALTTLDSFGEMASRQIPVWEPDRGELAARWIAEVKALTEARFAGRGA
jgi:hypothetical protein